MKIALGNILGNLNWNIHKSPDACYSEYCTDDMITFALKSTKTYDDCCLPFLSLSRSLSFGATILVQDQGGHLFDFHFP